MESIGAHFEMDVARALFGGRGEDVVDHPYNGRCRRGGLQRLPALGGVEHLGQRPHQGRELVWIGAREALQNGRPRRDGRFDPAAAAEAKLVYGLGVQGVCHREAEHLRRGREREHRPLPGQLRADEYQRGGLW